jgi:hypothetical protein
MLGLVLIYFVGKAFYDMAKKYNQSSWLYAILGVLSYYGGIVVGGVILGIILGLFYPVFLDETSETLLGLMTIPIGILACWGFYQLLKKKWHKDYLIEEQKKPKIADIGKPEEEVKPTVDFLIENKSSDDLGKRKDDDWRF